MDGWMAKKYMNKNMDGWMDKKNKKIMIQKKISTNIWMVGRI